MVWAQVVFHFELMSFVDALAPNSGRCVLYRSVVLPLEAFDEEVKVQIVSLIATFSEHQTRQSFAVVDLLSC